MASTATIGPSQARQNGPLRSICSRCSTSPAGSQGGNRYKEVVTAATEHLPRKAILKKLAVLEAEIACGMKALEALLEKAE